MKWTVKLVEHIVVQYESISQTGYEIKIENLQTVMS